MVDAVLFDWGHTLMDWAWDDELLAAGHEAGLHPIGRENAGLGMTTVQAVWSG